MITAIYARKSTDQNGVVEPGPWEFEREARIENSRMITKPTVLVLGAGASCPYGFPSAFDIVQKICDEVTARGEVTETLERCGVPSQQVKEFCLRVKNLGSIQSMHFSSGTVRIRIFGSWGNLRSLHSSRRRMDRCGPRQSPRIGFGISSRECVQRYLAASRPTSSRL